MGGDRSAEVLQPIDRAAGAIRARLGTVPDVAVVLGSGLGGFARRLEQATSVPYGDLPDWPIATVAGHAGTLVSGTIGGRPVLVLSGRVHLYEGHPASTVVFSVRALARAGVRRLVLTNAAGGINPRFTNGTLMAIDDHINLTGHNPLVGPNDATLGRRFPDMSEVYSLRLRQAADAAAEATGLVLEHGVYVGVLGPSYETPAEIRAFRVMGADAVGMSTVVEAIAARHAGLEVLGLSCIANMAAGLGGSTLAEEDVLAAARRAEDRFGRLLEATLARF